jgi:hypothetical protein
MGVWYQWEGQDMWIAVRGWANILQILCTHACTCENYLYSVYKNEYGILKLAEIKIRNGLRETEEKQRR